jgi:hypothetical protein
MRKLPQRVLLAAPQIDNITYRICSDDKDCHFLSPALEGEQSIGSRASNFITMVMKLCKEIQPLI